MPAHLHNSLPVCNAPAMAVDRLTGGDRPDERRERPESSGLSPVDRSLRGDTAREIWAETVERYLYRVDEPTGQRDDDVDPADQSETTEADQSRQRGEADWRAAIETTTPEIGRRMLANRTYIARVDIAIEDARSNESERSGVDRSLAHKWSRFGDQRDDRVSDTDIADAYEDQVKRDGPPEAEAAFQVGRERVVHSDGLGGLRVPGRLDQAITEASEQILTARGFHASAERPPDGGDEQTDSSAEGERAASEISDTAPELSEQELGEWLDGSELPKIDRAEEGYRRKTTAAVFDADGHRGLELSGVDERSEIAKEWISEQGWIQTTGYVETHAEVKVVVDMIRGNLPQHVTLVINNELCSEDDPRRVSCEAFIRESLPPGYSLRVYDHNRQMRYFEGEA